MAGTPLKGVSFLVVDDNAHMRRLIVLILRSFGAEDQDIREAADGKSALAEMDDFRPDMVITDLKMEPMNGIALAEFLRRDPNSPNPFVPIIMISAYTTMTNVFAARDAGVTEFVAKPVSAKALYSRISTIILKPRDFVRVDEYFGPDRRRRDLATYSGGDRRKTGEEDPAEDDEDVFEIDEDMSQDDINEVFKRD